MLPDLCKPLMHRARSKGDGVGGWLDDSELIPVYCEQGDAFAWFNMGKV